MRNEEVIKTIKEVFEDRETLCKEHGEAIKGMRSDIHEIKIEIAKIVTAYKVFIGIGSAVGAMVGFLFKYLIKQQ